MATALHWASADCSAVTRSSSSSVFARLLNKARRRGRIDMVVPGFNLNSDSEVVIRTAAGNAAHADVKPPAPA